MSEAEIVFVGTSDAFGAGGRRQTAILVRGAGGGLLLDCGPTTCTGLAQLGIARDAVDAIAISHFHGDHFGGIPLFLLAARYEDQRQKPLRIAGPPGVEGRVRRLAAAMSHDFGGDGWTFPIEFQELAPGARAQVGPTAVRSFPVRHNPDACPCGLEVELAGRRIVYSGDTGWFDELGARARGADLFICECTFYERDYPFHVRWVDLAERRRELDARRLIVTHLGTEMHELRGRLDVETADDGLVVRL
jgi:ribonuclease BN (tRNA processing enzyme)